MATCTDCGVMMHGRHAVSCPHYRIHDEQVTVGEALEILEFLKSFDKQETSTFDAVMTVPENVESTLWERRFRRLAKPCAQLTKFLLADGRLGMPEDADEEQEFLSSMPEAAWLMEISSVLQEAGCEFETVKEERYGYEHA